MLKIKKIYNNNIILAEDVGQLEHIVLGKGIAFNKKRGNVIEKAKIEKLFVIKSDQTMNQFIQLLNEVPVNQLELTNKIVNSAEKELQTKFNDIIYIGLTDHINYAIDRFKNSVPVNNALLWEIKRFYPKEFQAAMHSLELIKYYENILLPEDEAGFIALHFVNAQYDNEEMTRTIFTTEFIQDTVEILESHFKIQIETNSLNFGRFLTHLKFFINRILDNELEEESDDPYIYEQVKKKYSEVSSCVDDIAEYTQKKFHQPVTVDEKMYLTLHIQRLIK